MYNIGITGGQVKTDLKGHLSDQGQKYFHFYFCIMSGETRHSDNKILHKILPNRDSDRNGALVLGFLFFFVGLDDILEVLRASSGFEADGPCHLKQILRLQQ